MLYCITCAEAMGAVYIKDGENFDLAFKALMEMHPCFANMSQAEKDESALFNERDQ